MTTAVMLAEFAEAPAPSRAAPEAAPTKVACPAERPDEAAALVTARMCGGQVKISGFTNEYDEGWAQPNGQVRWEHHYRPARVQRDGGWVPVDTTLFVDADGMVRPKAAAVDLAFSGGKTGSPMVSMGEDGATVKLGSPVGALRAPILEGDVAKYEDVLPGVDLLLRADVDGYAQVLVLKDRKAATLSELASLEFPITSSGLTVKADAAGNLKAAGKDGKVRFTGTSPLMWDAPVQSKADGSPRTGGRTKVMPTKLADGTLTVTPDRSMLDDPATEYPVYLDPGVQAARSAWTMVDSGNPNTSYWNSTQAARVGTNNGGTNKYRSFFNLNVGATPIAGKHIVSSNLTITETSSASCTPRQVDAWSTTVASSTTTWNSQPTFSSLQNSQTVAKGFSSSCPAGTVAFNVTPVTQSAANGSWTNVTVGLRSPNETDNSYYKQFNNNPYLAITYSAYANISSRTTTPHTPCQTGSGRPYLNTTTPTLQLRVNDPEGASVRPEFQWSAVGGSVIGSAQPTPGKASGQTFTTTVPAGAFTNGSSYSWRARGYDSTSWGPWTGGCEFTVDTTAPAVAPTVTSSVFPEDQWAGTATTTGSFTLAAAGTTDAAAYVYGLDGDPGTVVNAGTVGGSATISLTPGEGRHALKVQTRDRAGNLGPVRTYTFYVGTGAVTAPTAGLSSAGKVSLSGLSRSTSTGVTYQWRRGDVDTWTTVPSGDVTTAAGAAISWPVASTGSGVYPDLVWNVAQTVNSAEAGAEALNGPLQVRASFTGSSSGLSDGVPFVLDRDQSEAATAEAGPGEVNLLTGNLLLGSADASTFGGLALQRSFNSRAASVLDPMFGPGWTASVKATGTTGYTKLSVTGSLVQVGMADGTTRGFTKSLVTSSGASFTPQLGAEDLSLTYTTTGDTYLLTEKGGDTVTFSNQSAGVYGPTGLKAAGSATASTLSWENVTVSGTATVRPTRLLAALPAGVTSCAPMVAGCRDLTFTYATATTATSTVPGDYLGRLKHVSFTAWDPDLPTPAMRTVVLARYGYDTNGRLRTSWDPRLDYVDGGVTKNVATGYTYNANGTLATLTPPGEEPWQFTYTTVPGDSGAGRLYKVSRSALTAGTAVQTVVYNVPISGAGAPVDMGPNINRWGQTLLPVDATAVYPPDIVPDGNPATGTLPSNSADQRVTVTYMDPNGRAINTMSPGGTVNATWYDKYGNTVRQLDAGNLADALWRSTADTLAEEAAYARRESTEYRYSADGARLLEVLEPERTAVLSGGLSVRGRPHLVNRYDEGAPAGTSYDMVTTETKSLQYLDNGSAAEADERVTSTTYDWTQTVPVPITSTVDPGGLALTTRMTYDSVTGQVASTTNPAGNAAGTTPATRRTVYYRAGSGSGYSECDNRAAWAAMPCRTFAASQPSGTELPVTITTYDLYGQARTAVQKNSTTTLRTTTVDFDAAGRPANITVTAAVGTPIERRRTVYDPATGRPTVWQTLNAGGTVTASVTTGRDSLGRTTTYTDADGNTSVTTYDLLGRPATINDGKGTQTFSYNADLTSQMVDSQAGTFTATYYNNGGLATETRPDGVTVNYYYNEAGQRTGVDYSTACGSATCYLYYDYAEFDAHQRTRWSWSSFSNAGYTYDKSGRLVGTDQIAPNGCTQRTYTFDNATNRKQLATYAPGDDGACQQSAPTNRTWTYDEADRVTAPAHTIDTLGRTLTVPSADVLAGTGQLQLTYYANDMTASITSAAAQASYTLDVLTERYRSYTVTSGGTSRTQVNHYSDDSDKPSWIAENGGYTRRIAGMDGLSAFHTGGHLEWQFANLHGDIVAMQIGGSVGLTATYVTDEYGKYVSGGQPRYGYLGNQQRSADNPGGLMTMGVRVYNPETGRFLSTDPVYGGNNNAYEYSTADPVNKSDVSGAARCWNTSHSSRKWYYWWGTYGGIRKDRYFRCVITHRDFKLYKKSGNYSTAVGILAAFLDIRVGAAFALAGWILKDWIFEEYDDRCDWYQNGAVFKFRHQRYYDRGGYFLAGTYSYRGAYCRPGPRWYD